MIEMTQEQRTEIEEAITIKLKVCDLRNKQTEGTGRFKLGEDELRGMKQVLHILGYELRINYNPYYHMNGEASTFTIKLLPQEA